MDLLEFQSLIGIDVGILCPQIWLVKSLINKTRQIEEY